MVECWHRVREVPGSIPSQGPHRTKDIIKMVPGTCLALNIKKGNTGSFSMIKIGLMLWIKSGIENPLKSEVIGCCGGDEKKRNDHAKPTKVER